MKGSTILEIHTQECNLCGHKKLVSDFLFRLGRPTKTCLECNRTYHKSRYKKKLKNKHNHPWKRRILKDDYSKEIDLRFRRGVE